MKVVENDIEYSSIVQDILTNKDFCELKYIEHHDTTKYAHSIRISYHAYKITRLLGLDYVKTARAGLLHDFAISKKGRSQYERFIDTFTHPKIALEESKKRFILSDMEENIIVSHMFPTYTALPKYLESWIVILTDKTIGCFELLKKLSHKLSYYVNIYILILFNIIK
jgi:uncharacterized protein